MNKIIHPRSTEIDFLSKGVLLFIFMLSSQAVLAQSIAGNNSVYETTTHTYTYTASSWFEYRWKITKGVSINEFENGLTFTVVVKWTTPGVGSVKLEEYDLSNGKNDAQWVSKANRNITVNACPSLTVPVMNSVARCGSGEITLSGSPGTNGSIIRWYTSIESTTPYTSGNSKNFTVSAAVNNYYISTFSESTGCESARTVVNAYVNPIPDTPAALNERQCGPGPIVLNASPDANGNTVKWYESPTAPNAFSTNNSFTATGLTSNTNYFISSFNLTSGCESASRASVGISVDTSVPPIPDVSNFTRCGPGGFTVVASGASNYNWYTPDLEFIHSGNSMTVTGPINSTLTNAMFVKSVNPSGCESPARWVSLVILPEPQITVSSTVIAMGKPVTLQMSGAYDAYSWRNQSNQQVGNESQFSTTAKGIYYVIVTKNGTYQECKSNEIEIIGQTDKLNKNYIITNTIQRKEVSSSTAIPTLTNVENQQSITYFDGLGRPQQTVATQGTSSERDLIQPFMYDEVQRENKKLLPYVSAEANGRYKKNALLDTDVNSQDELVKYRSGEQYNYYQGGNAGIIDSYPYAQTVFEKSALNKVVKLGAVGESWQPDLLATDQFTDKTIKMVYDFNSAADQIYVFKYNRESNEITFQQYYQQSSLSVKRTYDERNFATVEFMDRSGRVVCKKVQYAGEHLTPLFVSTYYIYDDLGNLVLVLPPESVEKLKTALNLN